jgi:Uma2 family endonuclease
MTYAEYLAFERASSDKHEFVDGEVFAMAGGTYAHSLVGANVIGALINALRGRSCRPLTSDMRVRTGDDVGAYPDASVVCGAPMFSDESSDELRNPTVIIEVLSPSTEAYDRGDKFAHYQTIASLRDYVLVATSRARIEVYSREDDGAWTLRTYLAGASVVVPSIDVRLGVSEIYDGAELTPLSLRRSAFQLPVLRSRGARASSRSVVRGLNRFDDEAFRPRRASSRRSSEATRLSAISAAVGRAS